MLGFLEALQSSAFGTWVLVSEWGYPILLTFHSIGLALVVGILCVIDLRILGIGRGLPLPAFAKLMRVVWMGFWVNAISGAAIFTSDAVKYYSSTTFRLKLLSIALGLVLVTMIKSSVLQTARSGVSSDGAPVRAKALATISLLCWLAAITAGRLMAYVD